MKMKMRRKTDVEEGRASSTKSRGLRDFGDVCCDWHRGGPYLARLHLNQLGGLCIDQDPTCVNMCS